MGVPVGVAVSDSVDVSMCDRGFAVGAAVGIAVEIGVDLAVEIAVEIATASAMGLHGVHLLAEAFRGSLWHVRGSPSNVRGSPWSVCCCP